MTTAAPVRPVGRTLVRTNQTSVTRSVVQLAADLGMTLKLAIGGPLSDTASARLAVLRNRSDGYIDNVHLGREDTNGHDETSVRATLEFTPNDSSAYGLTALYFDGRNGYDAFSLDNTRETLSDQPGRDNQETFAVAARGEWRLGDTIALETVATRLDSDLEYGFDEDWTFQGICDGTLCHPVDDFYSNTDNYLRDRGETSLDLRLLGDIGSSGRNRYVLGVYAQDRDEDMQREHYGDFFSSYRTDRRAIYGQFETAFNERLGLTLGLRFEDFSDSYSDTAGFQSASDDSRFGYYHLADIGGYGLINGSLHYRAGRTELQLWGRNLADEEYAVHGLYFGNDPRKGWINETCYQYGEPRVVGITAKYFFLGSTSNGCSAPAPTWRNHAHYR